MAPLHVATLTGQRELPSDLACNYSTASEIVEHYMTVEKMWGILKDKATKKLKPAIFQSQRANQFASPSTRQCLDLYEMHTATDKFTGKVK